MKRPWYRRLPAFYGRARRARKRERRSFFLAAGIAASLLLLAFVLQSIVPEGGGIVPRLPAPDFATFLPPGAVIDGAPLEIAALPQSSYVVSYHDGAAHLALVAWDKDAAAYELSSTLALDESSFRLDRVYSLSLQPMGAGDPLILARGPYDAWSEGVFAVARDAHGLGIVRLVGDSGTRGPAFFHSGGTASSYGEELSFEDADGDGRKEAVSIWRFENTGGLTRPQAHVYKFTDGEFVYDAGLSKLMTVSKSLFPEPAGQASP